MQRRPGPIVQVRMLALEPLRLIGGARVRPGQQRRQRLVVLVERDKPMHGGAAGHRARLDLLHRPHRSVDHDLRVLRGRIHVRVDDLRVVQALTGRVEHRRLRGCRPDVQPEDGHRLTRRNARPVLLPERTVTRTRPACENRTLSRATPVAFVRARLPATRTTAPLTAGRTLIVSRTRLPALTRCGVTFTASGGGLQVALVFPVRVTVTATSGAQARTRSSRSPFADVIIPPCTWAAYPLGYTRAGSTISLEPLPAVQRALNVPSA